MGINLRKHGGGRRFKRRGVGGGNWANAVGEKLGGGRLI